MSAANTSQTVLVVEDEVLIRMATVATLESAGYAVLEACDSAEALRILASNENVRVVVTDVSMPGDMDGLGLVKCLQRERPILRALVVSAKTCADEAIEAGAHGFLPKPFMPHSIIEAVDGLVKAA
jgi:two-component system, response regulator PdtaR